MVGRNQWVKMNSDTASNQKADSAGWGMIARNWQGKIKGVWAVPNTSCSNPKLEEAMALRTAMLVAKHQG